MPTKSCTLIPYHLRDHNIQSWRKSFFPLRSRGTAVFWRPKNHFSASVWLAGPQILVHSWVRYMCAKSHIHQRCGRLPKNLFSTKEYAEIHIQRPFFDNKNSIWKILGLKIQTVETCSTHRNFYFWKTLKSRFLAEFQSFIFGQILANIGSFGQIFLHSQWLRACPNLGWNLQNPITFQTWLQMLHATAHWKATIFLHKYKFFQKIPQKIIITAACLNQQKAVLAYIVL
jgi:hypothetical protein